MNLSNLVKVGATLTSALSFLFVHTALAEPAFKINDKTITVADVYKDDQAGFYELEKKKFELIDRIAKTQYLETFWNDKAKKGGKSVEVVREEYEKKNLKISEKEINETLAKYQDHPSLKKLPKAEQRKQIKDFIVQRNRSDLQSDILDSAMKNGSLVISYPEPEEPVYKVTVTDKDHVRFGPGYDDTKPVKCKGDDCAITIVEYSEFQCPFCVKVLPDVKKVMKEYEGRIRWVVRDFPLSFHDRARPAAIAAHCAGQQGKYWNMYGELFDNQRKLGDSDIKSYAKTIGLNLSKFDKCQSNSGNANGVEAIIDANFNSGSELGVTGTPAFFINGRRLSGALPYSEFRRVIESELSSNKKS